MRRSQMHLIHGLYFPTSTRILDDARKVFSVTEVRKILISPPFCKISTQFIFPAIAPCPLTNSQDGETLARLTSVRSATTRSSWESELVYLREFTSSDAAPTPVGFVVTGHEPPMTIDVIRELFCPGARPFIIIHASLRSAFLNIREADLVTRFNEELRQLLAPAPVEAIVEAPTACPPESLNAFVFLTAELTPRSASSSLMSAAPGPGAVCRKCGQPGHWRMGCPHLDDFRSGGPQIDMVGRLKRAMPIDKVGMMMSTVAESTRPRYKSRMDSMA